MEVIYGASTSSVVAKMHATSLAKQKLNDLVSAHELSFLTFPPLPSKSKAKARVDTDEYTAAVQRKPKSAATTKRTARTRPRRKKSIEINLTSQESNTGSELEDMSEP